MYIPSVIASTAIVLVEDSVSWAWGFGICFIANVIGLAIFLLGSLFYKYVKPDGSPFTALARVLVATIRKRKVLPSSDSENYYFGPSGGVSKLEVGTCSTNTELQSEEFREDKVGGLSSSSMKSEIKPGKSVCGGSR